MYFRRKTKEIDVPAILVEYSILHSMDDNRSDLGGSQLQSHWKLDSL